MVVVLLLSLISGCQTGKINNNLNLHYNLSELNHWELTARVSIKSQTEAVTATLNWTNNNSDFDFHLYGTFGVTYAHLTQINQQAVLRMPDDQTFYHQDAQQLLWQSLGWDFPIEALSFWVKGLPSGMVGEMILRDLEGKLISAELNQWQVVFSQYENYSGFSMPRIVKATHPQMSLKLIVKDWDFLPSD